MSDSERQRLKKALDAMIYLPHLKEKQNELSSLLFPSSTENEDEHERNKAERISSSLEGKHAILEGGKPWDRKDFYRRLQTFRASTWFSKPKCISAIECARRGWENSDEDILKCESCGAVLNCPISPQLLPDEADAAAMTWASKLLDGHETSCPWRLASSPLSLLRFPELPRNTVMVDFKDRCSAMERIVCIPPISSETINVLLSGSQGAWIAAILSQDSWYNLVDNKQISEVEKHSIGIKTMTQEIGQSNQGTASFSTQVLSKLQGKTPSQEETNRLILSLTSGVVGSSDVAFKSRIRALALCGWTMKPLLANASLSSRKILLKQDDSNKSDNSIDLLPENTFLTCSLCNSKVGIWNNFPGMEPVPFTINQKESHYKHSSAEGYSFQRPVSATKVERQLDKKIGSITCQRRASTGTSLIWHGKYSSPLREQICSDMSTTIAGGSLEPLESSIDDVNANQSQFDGDLKRSPNVLPLFGIDALKASEKSKRISGNVGSALDARHPIDKKRKRCNSCETPARDSSQSKIRIENVSGHPNVEFQTPMAKERFVNAEEHEKYSKSYSDGKDIARDGEKGRYLIEKYKRREVVPLDLMNLHRSFCPWVHGINSDSGRDDKAEESVGTDAQGSLCGWKWYAKQLGGDVSQILDFDLTAEDIESKRWDPAGLLKTVLAKMQVKK